MMLNLSHRMQLFFFHHELTISKLMLIITISSGLIFGMLFVKDAIPEGREYVSPMTVYTTSEGYTCIMRAGDTGQHCYSEALMQQIEMWRDSVRYLPTLPETQSP